MKIKLGYIFNISAIAMFLIGLGLTLMTSLMLGMIDLDANSASIHFAKAAGSAIIAVAVMTWLARDAGPSHARNALLFLLEVIEYLRGIITGSLGWIGWLSGGMWLHLFVYMFLAVGLPWLKRSSFARLLMVTPQKTSSYRRARSFCFPC
jgi:hypothetical protein